ncbi:MAG: hypothetical protein JWN04_572 [Myxococcaceae bacterium]|nr:hypothetical protein [Myxococcaceae bacterium]
MRFHLFSGLVAVSLGLLAALPLAHADDPARWLFVPVITQQRELPPWLASALDELAKSAEAQGVAVWSRDEAAINFERRHSTELSPVTPDDLQTLERLSDSAVKSMAAQHHAAALHELDAASRLYQRAPEEFNRVAPQVVLDLCLFRARALVETGEQILLVKQGIRDCRLRIPLEIEPNLLTHTNPTIRKLLAEVSSELASARSGRLLVQGPPGCPVRVDGVDVGRLRGGQVQFDNLLVGTHRVSVACEGAATRIYSVDVTGAETTLAVDAVLDASLRSRPYLHLHVDQATPQASVARIANVVSDALKYTSVVLASVTPGGPLVLRRLTPGAAAVETQIAAPAQIGEAWSPEQRAQAIEALLRPAPRPSAQTLSRAPAAPSASSPALAPGRLGLLDDRELTRWSRASRGLLGIAGAGLVTATALHFKARSVRSHQLEAYDDRSGPGGMSSEVARARHMGDAAVALGALQGVWLATGLTGPLLKRMEHRKSNAALMVSLSAVGAGLIGASIYPFIQARAACTSCAAARDNRTETGFLLAGDGMGLLAAPVLLALSYYLPMRLLGSPRAGAATATVGITPGRVNIQGTF